MSTEEKIYWLCFSAFEEGIGPVRFKKIVEKFGNAKEGWKAKEKDLLEFIPPNIVQRFSHFRTKFDIDEYCKILSRKQISFITSEDSTYPFLLKQISDPPPVLYVKGSIETISGPAGSVSRLRASPAERVPVRDENPSSLSPANDNLDVVDWWITDNKIAVVGSRIPTSYGKEITENLTRDLVENGLTIVSGMARGVDTVAHKTAIENNGKTIAVLGCGIDYIYPPENKDLYEKISEGNGCVISEMPLGHFASRGTFPARNRLISGLSKGVIMTEGAIDSGALITCSYAAEQGRDVFAVPGPVTSKMSQGTFSLLKKGAKIVASSEDILSELGIEGRMDNKHYKRYKDYNDYNELSSDERLILDLLKTEDLTIDDMIRKSRLPSGKVLGLLSLMELKGYIKEGGGKYKNNF